MVVGNTVTCIPRCLDNEYLIQNSPGEYSCERCHADCNGCTGPTQNDCTACRSFYTIVDGERRCQSQCSGNLYATVDGECLSCDPRCIGCSGITNLDCISCSSSSVLMGNAMCVTSCPSGQVYDTNTEGCIADP